MSVSSLQTGKLATARKIMRALRPAEDNIDNAILANADLIGSIIRGRMEMGAGLDLAHEAAQRAANSMARLFEAREEALRCHRDLTESRDLLGLSGSDVGCLPSKFTEARRDRLMAQRQATRRQVA
jgi:hypothetical protein